MAKRRRDDDDEQLHEHEQEAPKRRLGDAELPRQVAHSDASAAATGIASSESAAVRHDDGERAAETPQVDMELSGVLGEHLHAEANAAGLQGTATERQTAGNASADLVTSLVDVHDHMDADAGAFIGTHNDPSVNEDSAAVAGDSANPMVIAPMFTPVHRSWEEFEQRLKEYTQATYQMYVIRTTTSVKRRNLRITENASAAPTARVALGSTADAGGEAEEELSEARDTPTDAPQALSSDSDQVLIPESYQWYSKTLMCTHGWKGRNRGSGKRSLSIVRSTRCPAKMCVTLQHRGKGDDGWQVVLTRHVRTHNHQLSKELYLYYMENRRIYDPDLLLVGTSQPTIVNAGDPGRPHPHQLNRAKLSHLLASYERSRSSPQNASSEFAVPVGAQSGSEDANFVSQTASRAPKVLVKVHNSWEAFHKYIVKYSVATQQSFRARSTVSAAAKNAKTKTFALKAGRCLDDVTDQLIPEEERWYSKLMICNHGWKRKSRSKAPKSGTEGSGNLSNSCPAMLLARLQRDGSDSWRVVINRQVLEHNHSLTREKVVPVSSAPSPGARRATSEAATTDREPNAHTALHLFGNDNAGHHPEDHGGAEYDDDHEEEVEQRPNRTEIVIRAPKFEAIHASWEAFHARLQEYSDATFQLYRTRTTSSVQGRNQKIPDIKRALATRSHPNTEESNTRIIPEEWKWYSKTLTCTHGWKERRRGTGKRTIQVFRSTSCPVKICATVQFVEDAEANADPSSNSGSWRVVVTKHVVDHNHNLSKELHQHYCENRRIYDPDLLTIDESNEAAVVKQPRQHHSFLMNAEPPSFFPQVVAGFAQAKAMHTANDGREPSASADHGQLSGSGLHPLALMADVSSHPEQMSASPSTSAANSVRKHIDGVSAQAGLVQGFSAAPLISYTGAFPSGAGPHTLFPTAGSQQASQYLLHAHQFFAADPIGNSSIAQVAHSHLSAMGMVPASSDSNDMSSIANAAANAFLGSCRVHGSGPHPGSSGQCTCLRGSSPSLHYPLTNRSFQVRASEPSISGSEVRQQKSKRSERVSHGDESENENEEEPDQEPNGSVVWSPSLPVEITTVSTDLGTNIWRAPRIKRLHNSWDAFQEHLDLYSIATFQLYRVRTTSSVSSRNSRIAQQTAAREMPIPVTSFESSPQTPAAPRFVPDSYQWYSKTFVCTHGWKERRRGKGQRVSHSLRSTECSAKLCVTLQKPPHEMNSNKWHVVVTKQTTDHNHEISVQAYQQYSENRRIKDSSLLDQAEELWKKGLTRRKIYEFLKEQCPNAILMKDVHNLVQRWQAQQQPSNSSNANADGSSHPPTAAAGFTDAAEPSSTEATSERIQVLHEEHQI